MSNVSDTQVLEDGTRSSRNAREDRVNRCLLKAGTSNVSPKCEVASSQGPAFSSEVRERGHK
jgi:hypothetical protein